MRAGPRPGRRCGARADRVRRVGSPYRLVLMVFLVTLLGACGGPELPRPLDTSFGDSIRFPVAVAGTELLDAAGRPLVLNGDTPWSLAAQPDSAEVEAYLDVRRSQGVNALLFNAVEHLYADGAPRNANGDAPFVRRLPDGEEDLTALGQAYWSHLEWVLGEARERGMLVFLVPAYLGYAFDDSGWSAELSANGPDRVRAYGDSLGRRLRRFDHVVWVMGGDAPPVLGDRDLRPHVEALVEGIRGQDPEALFTAHSRRQHSALDSYAEPWLDLNSTYSDTAGAPSALLEDHRRTTAPDGAMPTFWIEGYYENEHGMTPELLRAQIYQALVSGGSGQFYGAFPVWSFGARSARHFGDRWWPLTPPWEESVVSETANDLAHVRRLIEALPLHALEPDPERWPSSADPSAPAVSRSADGSTTLAYLRRGRAVELGTSAAGASLDARWFDPRTGAWTEARPAATPGEIALFEPPTGEDWLLVLRTEASTGS